MITTTDLIGLFQQALKENWGYIWGTAGEKWTAARQKELEKTTDSDRAQGRKYGSKWIGHTVADCSGLFSWAFRKLGGYMYHGSDTMYRKYCVDKGELKKGKRTDSGTLKPGTAVFVWNGKKYSHVGLFVGDGTVIEAMGTINGVTTSRVTAGKWTHWGELAGVDYSKENAQCTMNNAQLSPEDGDNESSGTFLSDSSARTTLRKGMKGQEVSELQTMLMRLGYDLGPCGVDGDFGKDTETAVIRFQAGHGLEADGVVGKVTWAALEKMAGAAMGTSEEISYSVTIFGLDLTQATALQRNYPGSVLEKNVG